MPTFSWTTKRSMSPTTPGVSHCSQVVPGSAKLKPETGTQAKDMADCHGTIGQ